MAELCQKFSNRVAHIMYSDDCLYNKYGNRDKLSKHDLQLWIIRVLCTFVTSPVENMFKCIQTPEATFTLINIQFKINKLISETDVILQMEIEIWIFISSSSSASWPTWIFIQFLKINLIKKYTNISKLFLFLLHWNKV